MTLLLNCDLGESYGAWTMGADESVMPHIDQANIACGFHAGDPMVINRTLLLAKQHNVSIGAHPSYPDLAGFGRRSINCTMEEIQALVSYQIAALDGMACNHGLTLTYVKPHGALYNDMMKRDDIRQTIMQTVSQYHKPLHLMLQATASAEQHRKEADSLQLPLYFEAFADRRYDDNGLLLSRSQSDAVLHHEDMLQQVQQLQATQTVTTVSGKTLPLKADTLCVHGDNQAGVDAIAHIRQLIHPS